ncbi:hypothetical protein ACLB2K_068273 [Fragaria x ananassa]
MRVSLPNEGKGSLAFTVLEARTMGFGGLGGADFFYRFSGPGDVRHRMAALVRQDGDRRWLSSTGNGQSAQSRVNQAQTSPKFSSRLLRHHQASTGHQSPLSVHRSLPSDQLRQSRIEVENIGSRHSGLASNREDGGHWWGWVGSVPRAAKHDAAAFGWPEQHGSFAWPEVVG